MVVTSRFHFFTTLLSYDCIPTYFELLTLLLPLLISSADLQQKHENCNVNLFY
jgi:hypothetical protein